MGPPMGDLHKGLVLQECELVGTQVLFNLIGLQILTQDSLVRIAIPSALPIDADTLLQQELDNPVVFSRYSNLERIAMMSALEQPTRIRFYTIDTKPSLQGQEWDVFWL